MMMEMETGKARVAGKGKGIPTLMVLMEARMGKGTASPLRTTGTHKVIKYRNIIRKDVTKINIFKRRPSLLGVKKKSEKKKKYILLLSMGTCEFSKLCILFKVYRENALGGIVIFFGGIPLMISVLSSI